MTARNAAGPAAASLVEPAAGRWTTVQVSIWPVIVMIYATLLPREIRFSVSGLEFYADRIGLIIALPWVIKKLIDGAIKFVLPDFLMVFTGLWMIASMITHYGVGGGLASGGSLAMDATIGYFLARISFRSLTDIRRALILLAPGFFIIGLIMMVESLSHNLIIRPAMESIFGALPIYLGADAVAADLRTFVRLGLLRAYGPFVHPIVGGLYLASLLAIYGFSGIKGWPRILGIVAALFSFFTVSSAAIAALGLSIFLMTYEHLQQRVRELNWPYLFALVAAAWLVVDFLSNSGALNVLIRVISLDPATAYFRLLIWDFAGDSVWYHPWFGVGFAAYARPAWMVSESIDAHWLLLAVRFGLPAAIAQGAAVLVAVWALAHSSSMASGPDRLFYRGLAISVAVFAIMMFTVTLWGGTLSWFNLLLGGAVACAQRSYRI